MFYIAEDTGLYYYSDYVEYLALAIEPPNQLLLQLTQQDETSLRHYLNIYR